MGRRPKKPKRRFPGISALWSGGCWKWRALIRVDGKQVVGGLRDRQEDAYADRESLASRRAELPSEILTLNEAIEVVVADANARGLPPETIAKSFRSHANYLLRFWRPDTPLTRIDEKEIEWFVAESMRSSDEEGRPKRPRSPNTLKQKDLPLLRRCFEAARIPVPKMRPPKLRPPELRYFEMHEVAALIDRIRHDDFYDKKGKLLVAPARERHADLLQLFAQSGVRSGELGRITGADIDLLRGRIRVQEPKDRSNPRYLEITPALKPIVLRLLPSRREDYVVPGGMATISDLCRHWKKRLNEPRLSARALRHSFCTAQLAAGVPLNQVQSLMGHRSIRSTDRYVHAIDKGRARAAALLDRFFKDS